MKVELGGGSEDCFARSLTGEDEKKLGGHDGNEEDDEEDLGFMVLVDGLEGDAPHEAF